MSHVTDPNRPFGDLFRRIRSEADSRKPLQDALQLAVQIEFTTILAYLTALYSISQPDSSAYQLLRSVVMEEMFHVNQAANLLVAIGGLPKFTGDAAPKYPNYLPHANPATTPYVGLYRASPDVFGNIFAAIETPAPPHAPPQGKCYDTIAQVYEAAVDGLKKYSGAVPLFAPNPEGRQRTDIYLGKFGGKPILVTDMATAGLGVQQILQQGEGSVPEAQSYVPLEPWGTYNHYGDRTDGTYGPIIGTPYEMSHFKKFRTVALDTANFPSTYPIVSNARREDFSNPVAIKKAELFDAAYSIMLDALELSFRQPLRPGMPDPFFALALPLMHKTLPDLARVLMTTPTRSEGDGSVGPNAAPTFVYRSGCSLSGLGKDIQEAMRLVKETAQDSVRLETESNLLANALKSVAMLAANHSH